MKTIIVGIGGMTNGGKSTLATRLHLQIANSCLIAQDAYFKEDSNVPVDSNGFKLYDVLDALYMEKMMNNMELWKRDPERFMKEIGLRTTQESLESQVFVLIVEGFLIFNYRPMNYLYDKKYFIEIPYNICKKRRSTRVYMPPDPPGYFDGQVWPMYLKNREEMEAMMSDIVFIDGLQEKEQVLDSVYKDVMKIIEELRGKR
ncbi:nicotinamide riboside kinase 1 [Eucyclogobius newberryi]|uniref:nicotinamide riboside kinase 1 n=1 Tax=Eucyclogobius newberryi TaxID=166745 RepID=UPI003B59D8D1